MYRGEHVDILYGNVKHAFFQVKLEYSSFGKVISVASVLLRCSSIDIFKKIYERDHFQMTGVIVKQK